MITLVLIALCTICSGDLPARVTSPNGYVAAPENLPPSLQTIEPPLLGMTLAQVFVPDGPETEPQRVAYFFYLEKAFFWPELDSLKASYEKNGLRLPFNLAGEDQPSDQSIDIERGPILNSKRASFTYLTKQMIDGKFAAQFATSIVRAKYPDRLIAICIKTTSPDEETLVQEIGDWTATTVARNSSGIPPAVKASFDPPQKTKAKQTGIDKRTLNAVFSVISIVVTVLLAIRLFHLRRKQLSSDSDSDQQRRV